MPKAKSRFRPCNPDQNAMVVINYQDQLQPGIFEHAVHYLIEHKLDLFRRCRQAPSPQSRIWCATGLTLQRESLVSGRPAVSL